MSSLVVFIEDRIRDERVRHQVDVDSPPEIVIQRYVEQFGMPRLDFDLSPVEYRLMRAVDETYLPRATTLSQAGIAEGELLELFSPEGRRVWGSVQRLLGEIESEIKDPLTGTFKDQIVEEAWHRVTKKLDEIEKTQTGGRRVEQIREWVESTGGPIQAAVIPQEPPGVPEPYHAASTAREAQSGSGVGKTVLTVGLLAVLAVILAVGSVLVCGALFAPGDVAIVPDSTARPISSATEPRTEHPTPRPAPQEEGKDTDGDGLTDEYEAELGADAGNPDTDGDGYGDGEEIDLGTDPLDPNDPAQGPAAPEDEDTDGDGLTDEFEAQLGADAGNPDTDGDGYGDGEEIDLGTDPLDPNDPAALAEPPPAPPPAEEPPPAPPTDTPGASPTPKSTTTFRLINSSTHTICEFRLSMPGACDPMGGGGCYSGRLWEIDASDPLYPGEEVTWEVEPDRYYTWKLVACSHQVLEDLSGVKIEGDEFKVEISQTGTSYPNFMTPFRLINSSPRDICAVYLEEDTPYTHDPFMQHIMSSRLPPGGEFTRNIEPGLKRFQILDCGSNVLDEQWGVEFVAGEEFRWEISH